MNAVQQQIVDLIESRQLSELAAAGEFAAVAESLTSATVRVDDPTEYDLQTIGERVGEIVGDAAVGLQARRLFADTLAAAIAERVPGWGELQAAQIALGAGRLVLSGDDRQAFIDQLGTGWPEQIRQAIKSLGVRMVSPAADAGIEDVTAEVVASAWQARQKENEILRQIGRVNDANSAVAEALRAEPKLTDQEIAAVYRGALS